MSSMSAAERALFFFGRLLVRCFYRITALGSDNLPKGGFLLLPNHITWVDAIVLQLACPRRIRFPPFALRRKKSPRARSYVFFPRASCNAPGRYCGSGAVTN